MKDKALKILRSKIMKRAVCIVLVFSLLFGIVPFDGIINEEMGEMDLGTLTVKAATEHEFSHVDDDGTVVITMEQLVRYSVDCENDRDYHKDDKLYIRSGGDTTLLSSGFKGLGDDEHPFGGSITIETDNNIAFGTLNLDAPLFNCVYDDVVISDGVAPLLISREYGTNRTETTPIIAKTVRHRGNGNAKWKISIVKPSDDTENSSYNLDTFGGLIGTMEYDSETEKGACLELEVTMDTKDDDTAEATIKGSSDVGFICGEMQQKTSLSVTFESNRGVGDITTTSGNAGGLVGSISEGASFDYNGPDPQAITSGAKSVKTDKSGYAGGIVGKNDKGIVTLSTSPYPVGQTIEGTLGAGGIYGYYSPEPSSDVSIDTSVYSVDCQVNGTGDTGGLIGKLECANNVEINGTGTVTSDHASGSAACYGGLIGLYINDASHSLTVGSVSVSTAGSGSADNYGGCIGIIDDAAASYAVFNDPDVTSADTGSLNYGGLVASADNAFVDVDGASVTTTDSFKGGALVGSLDRGVLRIDGTVDLSGAVPAAPTKNDETDETNYVGKVVGWRDDALVFKESTCTLSRPAAAVDDIGAWGQILNFTTAASDGTTTESLDGSTVLSIDESTHTVTITAPSDLTNKYKSIGSLSDYAKTALCFQIDADNNSFVNFADEGYTYSTIANEDITLKSNVVLTDTGLTGLTRDNDISSEADGTKCTFGGTFEGSYDSTVHSVTFGGETVYRHSYNGLFAIADCAVIQNTAFDGTISVNALDDMYLGTVAAAAKGDFTAAGIVISTALGHAGSSSLSVGGILGEALSDIEDITIGGAGDLNKVTVNADLTGSASGDVRLGGVIGKISHAKNADVSWSLTNVEVSGGISNTAQLGKNQVGGLIASISGFADKTDRQLKLSSVYVDDLDISVNAAANGTVGGLLGYAWLSVDTDFDDVQIDKTTAGSSITNSGTAAGVDLAGLVYNGTGYWTVKDANDIKINGFSLVSDKAQSFGMIVNKAWAGSSSADSALYLELQSSGAYSLNSGVSFKKSDGTTDMTIPVFDELAAHTAFYTGSGANKVHYSGDPDNLYILQNKQAVVSIQTSNANGGLIMDGTSASGSYTPVTSFGKQMNPCSRYYYNLFTLKTATSGASGLMTWGAKWYAHDTIQNDVSSNTSWGTTVPAGTYNMQGYSWYPLNIDKSTVTVNGTFTFYNREFELSEAAANTADSKHSIRTSLYNDGTMQHYLMQSALFNNVSGRLNVGTVTLKGSIPQIDTRTYEEVDDELEQTGGDLYSGALVLGTVKGSGATDSATAKVTTTNLVLDGVYVYNFDLTDSNDYAPLIINKADSYSSLVINGVKVGTDSSYKTNAGLKAIDGTDRKAGVYPKIATSLIGSAGKNKNSKNINVSFNGIKLDARKTNTDPELDQAYHTQVSLFTKSTLLDKLTFDTGKGTYTYNYSDDWNESSAHDADHCVTYGKEVGYTNDSAYANTQYPNKERWYLDQYGTVYTNPSNASDTTGEYSGTFDSSYLPYVYVGYNSSNKTYQLEVNHSSPSFGGCGTYNDPYVITSGTDFNTIYSILSSQGDPGIGTAKIYIPLTTFKINNVTYYQANLSATWHQSAYGHEAFIYKPQKSITVDGVETVFDAGYYKYVDGTENDYQKNTVNGTTTYRDHYLSTTEMRTYVAGAYYKLSPANDAQGNPSNVITISGDTFQGLGYTTDTYAQFRGVIVGTGIETIQINNGYPLIAISNGSVVKDINIVVNGGRTITQSGAESFSAAPLQAYSYGAVIGTVLGGDNIIDGVTVTFQNTTITLSGSKAQLIPVGGYVGVIEKGGVIFRGMEGQTGISGIPAGVVTSDTSDDEMTAETNMRWLYVNPIIGRVINGYAVTEASAYRPFENGTRVYHGGARTLDDGTEDADGLVTEYWLETKGNDGKITSSISTDANDKDKAVGVTMRNGNKHYSITDIDPNEANMLDTYYNSKDNNIGVPNGQAFFIMSLMVNSGIRNNSLGYSTSASNYCIKRWADYSDIEVATTKTAPSTGDYSIAKSDSVSRYGYLASAYTTNVNKKDKVSGTITLTGSGTYYLPDGYKGIGNFFQNDNNYRMTISTFNGNNATISQNTYYYYYDVINDYSVFASNKRTGYVPNGNANNGLGLINYISSVGTYKDFYLTGNVETDLVGLDGSFITVKTAKSLDIDNASATAGGNPNYLCAGMLGGVAVASPTITNVAIKNVCVYGIRNTGGLIGYITGSATLKYNIDASIDSTLYNSENIKVHGRASTGGLVGKINPGLVEVDMSNHTFNLTEVVCECLNRDGNYYDFGVGGFIGMIRRGDNNMTLNVKANSFTNIVIGTKEKAQIVKCKGADIFTAGVCGIMNKSRGITIDNCTFYNLSVEARFAAAGLVAFPTTWTPAKVTNTHLYSPLGSTIESTTDYAGGLIGSSDPRTNTKNGSQDFEFNNCSVEGYTISGKKGAGGVIGFRGAVDESSKYYLSINNSKIYNCTIKSEGSAGGLIGEMNQPVVGYNILASEITIEPYTSGKAIENSGYICGRITTTSENVTYAKGNNDTDKYTNARKDTKPFLRLTGFSRQAKDLTKMEPSLVGTCNYGTGFGTGGYVIFADYNDKASTAQNTLFANVYNSGSNVDTMRSAVTTTKDGESVTVYDEYSDKSGADTEAGNIVTNADGSVTVTKNENYPYVTSSPKTKLDPVNYITGDGIVLNTAYTSSNFYKIISDTSNKSYTVFKRYDDEEQMTDALTNEDKDEIRTHYSSTSAAYNNNANVINFPLLEVNDVNTSNTTRLINNYINVLANTKYNYADITNSAIYKVDFYKYRLDTDTGSDTYNQFRRIEEGSACLTPAQEKTKDGIKYVFKMSADNVDTGSTPQFTLMDVQYKDPSDPDKIAYHLYVPIYVNQILRFDYNASVVSNTDYYRSAYYDSVTGKAISQYMFENLGNAVTMEFEYDYHRTPSEWADMINGGVNVLSNYYKTLNINTRGQNWPADTRLVLVDASNKDKYYYLDDPETVCSAYIDLYDFVEKDETTHFKPAPLQNLMTLSVVPTASGNLIATTDETKAVVSVDGTLYRPITEDDEDTSKFIRVVAEMPVKAAASDQVGELIKIDDADLSQATVFDGTSYYKPATDSDKENVNLVKYNTESDRVEKERYYLSFFTKESDVTTVYHFEIQTRDTFEENSIAAKTSTGTSEWTVSGWQPNKLYGSNPSVDIVLGNLYDNTMKLDVTPMIRFKQERPVKPQLMNDDNYYLTIQMTSTVKLKETAKAVASNLAQHPEATIYQTFLMKYDKRDAVGGQSELGLDHRLSTMPSELEYYIKAGDLLNSFGPTVGATDVTDDSEVIKEASTHIELRNNQNLVGYLADSSKDNAVTLQVKYDMVYSSNELSYQFPVRQNEGDAIGSKVIGYSNISSSITGAAYSSTSISKEDNQKDEDGVLVEDGLRYYTDDDTKASLTYDVVPVDKLDEMEDPNSEVYGGKYSYLGINAYETAKTSLFVDTYAIYDIRDIQNPGDYIELTLSLSQKGSYLKPATGSPHSGSGTALDITKYFKSLKIYGKNSDVLYNMEQDTRVNASGSGNTRAGLLTGSINTEKDLITLRVHKSLLQTQGDSDSKIYMIPISFEVITGDGAFNDKEGGLTYSNYKVSVTAATYLDLTTDSFADSSYAYNHLIYTNAKTDPEVIDS